jgi:hypothetical protein
MTLRLARAVRGLALAVVISALAAPIASAISDEQLRPDARSNSELQATPVRVVEVEADRGFDWGDAGIGATAVLALLAIGAGAAIATGHRPGRNPQTIR